MKRWLIHNHINEIACGKDGKFGLQRMSASQIILSLSLQEKHVIMRKKSNVTPSNRV